MADYNDKVVNAELILPEGDGGVVIQEDGQFHTEDTTTVTLLGNGSATTPLRATVVVDPASGNAVQIGADGISVGVSPVSDNLLVLAGGKLYVAPPQIVVPISSKPDNTLVEVTDPGQEGLYVPPGEKGDTGPQGPQGDPGVGIYIQGILSDPSQLPPASTMQEGDTYVIGTHYWTIVNQQWVDLGDFAGPQGQDGIGLVIKGAFADTSLLPTEGNTEGDTYIIQDQMWVWTGDADGWQPVGQVGPTGPQGPTGATGPQGIQGIQGEKGNTGNTGPSGPQGATGQTGPQGPKGDKGDSATFLKFKGDKATVADLPAFGNAVADAWYVQEDNHVYAWSEDQTWDDVGEIKGPQGDTGPQGPAGAGLNYKGTVPSNGSLPGTGNVINDMYFVTGTHSFTIWNGTMWVSTGSVQGDQGPAGADGQTGQTGPQGIQGVAGPKGDQGLQGLTGPVGPAGAQGPAGPQGPQGYGVRILGTKSAVGDLPATGTQGDAWIIVPNLYVWSQSDLQWINTGPYVGPKGDKGDQGNTGPAGPQGDTGADGPQGIGFVWMGVWNSTTVYTLNMVVEYQGSSYVCLSSSGVAGEGRDPVSWPAAWDLMAQEGADGPAGEDGPTGPQGPMGVSLVARGTVSNEASLPTTGNQLGDFYTTEDTGNGFAWDGLAWAGLGVMRGPQGDEGIQGEQGVDGPQGPQGDAGPTGPTGPQGPKGDQGAGVTVLGSLDSTADLPSTGTVGEGYIIDGNFWVWTGTEYENTGPIQGPQGPQGPTGPTGPQGTQGIQGVKGDQGTLWLNFSRNPGPADGRVGDYFINKATLEYFQKTSATVWASLGYMGGGNVYDTSETTIPQARVSGSWVAVPVLEAPTDSGYYLRVNGAWKKLDRYDLLVTSSTGAMDVNVSQVFKVDGTASKTMSFANLPANRAMTVVIVFAGSGASLTWPSGLSWSNGTAPVLGTTRTVVTVLWDGTNLTGTTSLTVS